MVLIMYLSRAPLARIDQQLQLQLKGGSYRQTIQCLVPSDSQDVVVYSACHWWHRGGINHLPGNVIIVGPQRSAF